MNLGSIDEQHGYNHPSEAYNLNGYVDVVDHFDSLDEIVDKCDEVVLSDENRLYAPRGLVENSDRTNERFKILSTEDSKQIAKAFGQCRISHRFWSRINWFSIFRP